MNGVPVEDGRDTAALRSVRELVVLERGMPVLLHAGASRATDRLVVLEAG